MSVRIMFLTVLRTNSSLFKNGELTIDDVLETSKLFMVESLKCIPPHRIPRVTEKMAQCVEYMEVNRPSTESTAQSILAELARAKIIESIMSLPEVLGLVAAILFKTESSVLTREVAVDLLDLFSSILQASLSDQEQAELAEKQERFTQAARRDKHRQSYGGIPPFSNN